MRSSPTAPLERAVRLPREVQTSGSDGQVTDLCTRLRSPMIENIYAAVAEPTAATVAQFSGIPVHPGEDTSAKEEDDFWRQLENVLATTDAAHFIQGRTPPRLVQLEQADLSGYTAVTVPSAGGLNQQLAAVEHNRKVESAAAENKRRTVMLDDLTSAGRPPRSRLHWIRLFDQRRLHC